VTLLELFERLEASAVGSAIRDSLWLFPVIEAVHLLGLALLGGAVLVVDLRLLGAGLTGRPLAYVAAQLEPWLLGAVAVMVTTGVPLFLSEAVKCYHSDAFRLKMVALALALAFTFGVRNRVAKARPALTAWRARAVGACSLALWLTVAAAGRWIGFS
jgi:hypothetical protein